MNSNEYQRAAALFASLGLRVAGQEYSERAFGSWYLVASMQPARRLVWDGKERWYVVEEDTAERFNGLPVWRELWIDRSPRADSLEKALDALLSR